MFIIIFLSFWGISGFVTGTKHQMDFTNSRFGPFYMVTRSVDKCHLLGPVDTENECSQSLSVYKINRIREAFRGRVSVPRDLPRFSSTLTADLWRDGGYKPFYSKVFENACQDGISGIIIKKFFNVGKSGLIKRGNYSLDGFEPYAFLRNLIGESFFYERISMTISWYTKKGFINCVKLSCESRPMLKNLRFSKNQTQPAN